MREKDSRPQSKPRLYLFFWILEGDHQHHIPSLELQLICVGGRVVVLGLHLQKLRESSTSFPQKTLVPPCDLVQGTRPCGSFRVMKQHGDQELVKAVGPELTPPRRLGYKGGMILRQARRPQDSICEGGIPPPGHHQTVAIRLWSQYSVLTLNMNPGGRSKRPAPLPPSTVPFTAAGKVSTTTAGREL